MLTRDAAMLPNYPLSVASSLSLSLSRIAQESMSARGVLNCLAYLAPDNITKPLFQGVCTYVPLTAFQVAGKSSAITTLVHHGAPCLRARERADTRH